MYPKIRLSTLLSCEPPTYGRHDEGTSSTIATHQPKLATNTTQATASCQTRRQKRVGAAIR